MRAFLLPRSDVSQHLPIAKFGVVLDLACEDGGVYKWEICRFDLLLTADAKRSKVFRDLLLDTLRSSPQRPTSPQGLVFTFKWATQNYDQNEVLTNQFLLEEFDWEWACQELSEPTTIAHVNEELKDVWVTAGDGPQGSTVQENMARTLLAWLLEHPHCSNIEEI